MEGTEAGRVPTDAPSEDSTLGHANRVEIDGGLLEKARYVARNALLFGGNRVVSLLPSHHLRLWYYRHAWDWTIGKRTSIHHGLKIFGGRGRVRIGNGSTLQMDCLVVGAGMDDLVIGDGVAISYQVKLVLGSHDIMSPDFAGITGPITIEDRVWIGTGATILLGVTLGEGTVVSAGSVVTKSTPPFSIVRGNPAQVVGRRRQDLTYSIDHFWPFH